MSFNSYKEIELKDMYNYILEKAPNDKAWFKSIAFVERPEKQAVKLFNEDGSPKMVTTKDGKQKQATRLEVKPNGEKKLVFNLLKAKKEFCQRYMPELLPKKKVQSLVDEIRLNW